MKLFLLAILQSALLAGSQVLLKIALRDLPSFAWTWDYWRQLLLNLPFFLTGVFFAAGSLLWLYIIRHYPFSMAYPLVSLSYVFGMLAALWVFHETVPVASWVGLLLILSGCWLIAVR